jgi:Tol biopolymer transport system component
MDRDGGHQSQITKLSAASFAPSWHPDLKRLIFASNVKDPQQRNFDIFLINVDGSGLEQVTFNGTFDGFPMFSPDGKPGLHRRTGPRKLRVRRTSSLRTGSSKSGDLV